METCLLRDGGDWDGGGLPGFARERAADAAGAGKGWSTIHNDFYWTDDAGARILTRSGCLCQFNGLYYWYGGNPRGFREQYCYVSDDLRHWVNKGVVLRQEVDANRIDVLYCAKTKTYVMFLKYNGNGAHFAIATAEKPEGPFVKKSETLVDGALMGDMSMFEDNDGTAYLAYVSWAVGTNAQHGIYRMSDDYMTLEKRMYLWDVRGREAPHIFKRNGIYYYGTSKTAWVDSTGTKYYMAKNLEGPWSEAGFENAGIDEFVGHAGGFCVSDSRDQGDGVFVCRGSVAEGLREGAEWGLCVVADGV